MKRISLILLVLAAAAAMALSCSKALETKFNTQESNIDKLITSLKEKNPDIVATEVNGSWRITLVPGTGDALAPDGTVSFFYAGYVLTGSSLPAASSLFATNHAETARQSAWNLTDADTLALTVNIAEDNVVTGLKNGLQGIKKDEECYIVFSGKYGFGKKAYGTIPANSALLYHIWAENVVNK